MDTTITNLVNQERERVTSLKNEKPSIPSPALPPLRLNCPDCGGLGFFRVDVPPDHPLFGKPQRCENEFHAEDRLAKLADLSGLQQEDLGRRLADIQPSPKNKDMLAAAQDLIDEPGGWLYIWGGPGNAKSEVLKAIVNQLNEYGHGPAMYIKFSQVVDYMRDAFAERDRAEKYTREVNLSYVQRFERLKTIPVLCIDEMDKVRDTPFVEDFRFDFLDERYQTGVYKKTTTVFAGNTDPKTFPMPIYDRLRDGRFKIVCNDEGSSRPAMR